MLGDTGNKRAVRILLECILVLTIVKKSTSSTLKLLSSNHGTIGYTSNCDAYDMKKVLQALIISKWN